MSIQAQPRYTATRPTPQNQHQWGRATCRRCGIDFPAYRREKTDRTHCHDCKPYTRKDN